MFLTKFLRDCLFIQIGWNTMNSQPPTFRQDRKRNIYANVNAHQNAHRSIDRHLTHFDLFRFNYLFRFLGTHLLNRRDETRKQEEG